MSMMGGASERRGRSCYIPVLNAVKPYGLAANSTAVLHTSSSGEWSKSRIRACRTFNPDEA